MAGERDESFNCFLPQCTFFRAITPTNGVRQTGATELASQCRRSRDKKSVSRCLRPKLMGLATGRIFDRKKTTKVMMICDNRERAPEMTGRKLVNNPYESQTFALCRRIILFSFRKLASSVCSNVFHRILFSNQHSTNSRTTGVPIIFGRQLVRELCQSICKRKISFTLVLLRIRIRHRAHAFQ